jgi:hypothetical protein
MLNREEQVEKALDRIPDLEVAFENACTGYATAESDYRIEFSKAFLRAEGTEKARNAEALIAVEKFLRERDKAEAVKEFLKEKLRDAQQAVSAHQSLLNAQVRTNAAFTG